MDQSMQTKSSRWRRKTPPIGNNPQVLKHFQQKPQKVGNSNELDLRNLSPIHHDITDLTNDTRRKFKHLPNIYPMDQRMDTLLLLETLEMERQTLHTKI